MQSWATWSSVWSSSRQLYPWQGCWKQIIFEVSSNPSHPIIQLSHSLLNFSAGLAIFFASFSVAREVAQNSNNRTYLKPHSQRRLLLPSHWQCFSVQKFVSTFSLLLQRLYNHSPCACSELSKIPCHFLPVRQGWRKEGTHKGRTASTEVSPTCDPKLYSIPCTQCFANTATD